jgi:hypothetical protein
MGRVAKLFSSKNIFIPLVIIVMLAGIGVGLIAHDISDHHVDMVTNSKHQLTQLSYKGQNGVNAFTLLKSHATVTYKSYSFGKFVTSIDGVYGNGPKYWTLYVNNKESNVGASAYTTKSSDTITWKLQ